jgi:hypothetical protein
MYKNSKNSTHTYLLNFLYAQAFCTYLNEYYLKWKPEVHLAATLPDDTQDEGVGDGGLDVQGLVVQCLQFLSTKIKK